MIFIYIDKSKNSILPFNKPKFKKIKYYLNIKISKKLSIYKKFIILNVY